jgi:hypothetical protein
MRTSAPHIRELIAAGVAAVFPQTVSLAADRIVYEAYPLKTGGGIIDWAKIPGATVCRWMQTEDADVIAWAKRTTAGQHKSALLLYGDEEPCLIGDFQKMIGNLDALIWAAAGPRLVFGIDFIGDSPGVTSDIIEFNGVDLLLGQIIPWEL